MQAHEQILADTAELGLIDDVVRLMPRRRARGCVVVDDTSREAVVAAIDRSAAQLGVAAPDVARVVSSFRPDLTILPVAATAGEAMANQAAFGTVLYLPEPFESNDLGEAVEQALISTVAGGTQ